MTPRTQPIAATRSFGQPLLGSVGPVSAEMVKQDKNRYHPGDYAGVSGLQGGYDRQLSATSGFTITPQGHPDTVLFQRKAKNGTPLRLTLDTRTQQAAEEALTGTDPSPSALVALDLKSGQVLAAANSPASGFPRALTGHYPPGSALKVVTTYALLSRGLASSDTVDCPAKAVVDGLEVKNFRDEKLGAVSFAKDFAHSCNTAFVALSKRLDDAELHRAAGKLGVGGDWAKTLGVPNAYAGSVPVATGATDKAAASFGQGRTLASPLALAVMTGSVARGAFIAPTLISSPAVKGASHQPVPLDQSVAKAMRPLMRGVVTDGTATTLKDVPGGPVYGKTGTSEHDSSGEHPTTWMVGWQGDVVFAVLVEDGKSGGETAAPIAKKFLTALR